MTDINPITVQSLDEFTKKVRELRKPNEHWIFRGQANAHWRLETSLQRMFRRLSPQNLRLREAEEFMLREFQRHYDRYFPTSAGIRDDLE